jgi:hypothetical protein
LKRKSILFSLKTAPPVLSWPKGTNLTTTRHTGDKAIIASLAGSCKRAVSLPCLFPWNSKPIIQQQRLSKDKEKSFNRSAISGQAPRPKNSRNKFIKNFPKSDKFMLTSSRLWV